VLFAHGEAGLGGEGLKVKMLDMMDGDRGIGLQIGERRGEYVDESARGLGFC